MTPYHAAMTRRWHTNEHLSHTVDPIAYHGARMAVLYLMFWPNELNSLVLADCITHDFGEYKTGDIPFGSPNKDHEYESRQRYAMGMGYPSFDPRVKWLDILDAYLWAQHHAPSLLAREDWQKQRQKIIDGASGFGVNLIAHDIHI